MITGNQLNLKNPMKKKRKIFIFIIITTKLMIIRKLGRYLKTKLIVWQSVTTRFLLKFKQKLLNCKRIIWMSGGHEILSARIAKMNSKTSWSNSWENLEGNYSMTMMFKRFLKKPQINGVNKPKLSSLSLSSQFWIQSLGRKWKKCLQKTNNSLEIMTRRQTKYKGWNLKRK